MSHRQSNALRAPVPAIAPDAVHWFVGPRGYFRAASGPALARVGLTPGQLIGRHYQDVYADNDAMLTLWRDVLMRGEAFEGVMEYGGLRWSGRAVPVWGEDEFLGVMASATIIEQAAPAVVVETAPTPFARVYELARSVDLPVPGDPYGARLRFTGGTRFIQQPGAADVLTVGRVTGEDLAILLRDAGDWMHAIHPRPSAAAASARRGLGAR